jgi:hypothetical protein
MRFTIDAAPQRSPAWLAARCGRLTGSRAKAMLARVTYGEARTRSAYRRELVQERYTGVPNPAGFVSDAMHRGLALEAEAIAAYEAETATPVQRTGFLTSTAHLAGCSPDGLLDGGRGVLEVKCPSSATHARYLMAGRLPPEHRAQLRHNVWIAGAAFAEFVSYDDRVAPRWRVFFVRVEAGELDLGGYERQAIAFLLDVEAELRAIVRLLQPSGAGLSRARW